MKARTPERENCLGNMLAGAIENGGYGSFSVSNWHCPGNDYAQWLAEIEMDDDPDTLHRVDLDTIAKGLGVVRHAELRKITDFDGSTVNVLHNAETGQRMFMSLRMQAAIGLVNRTNGSDGDLDAIDYLAILECALFGYVKY